MHNARRFSAPGLGRAEGWGARRWFTTASLKPLKTLLCQHRRGYVFDSQTDTEVIAHLIDSLWQRRHCDEAVRAPPRCSCAVPYAIAVPRKGTSRSAWWGARVGSRRWCWAWAEAGEEHLPGQRRRWPWRA